MTTPHQVIAELCHNKRVATDLGQTGYSRTRRESDALFNLRRRLTTIERQRLRELGRTLSLAVEATCRNFLPGEREADVAGHLAHRLIREGVVPVDLRVASDDRLGRYRQPTFKASPIRKRATIAVTGRRHGLCASITRTVAFGKVDHGVSRESCAGHDGRRHLHLLLASAARSSPTSFAGPSESTRNSIIRTSGPSTTRGA